MKNEYSEGICGDGAAILRNGVPLSIEEILETLRAYDQARQPKLSMGTVFELIRAERKHQDQKWGSLEEKQQSCAGYLLILEAEIKEAKEGWEKNKEGKHSALREIIQVAATAVACLQQYGEEGNPL